MQRGRGWVHCKEEGLCKGKGRVVPASVVEDSQCDIQDHRRLVQQRRDDVLHKHDAAKAVALIGFRFVPGGVQDRAEELRYVTCACTCGESAT